MKSNKDTFQVEEFLLSRQRPDGGFSFSSTTPSTLEDIYYLAKILDIIKKPIKIKKEHLKFIKHNKYLSEIKQYIWLMIHSNISFNKKRYICLIRECQNGDGGFGFMKGTTSFIENTYDALYTLNLMNSYPLYADKCESFILGCKSEKGFGRQINTEPAIEYTYYAIASLNILSEIRKVK